MKPTLNMAVIGCGYWGPNLVRNFNALPDVEVSRVCDASASRLAHIQELYPRVKTTASVEEVYRDSEVDAVAIATPVRTHFSLAREALLAGKHVFIEKPMAASVAQCEALIGLAKERGLRLMVGHTFLYSSPIRAIKDLIESGALGPILYVTSRRLNLGLFQKDINVAWDLAPHDISIILYLLGGSPEYVACQGKAGIADGIEDVTNMTIGFGDGVLAFIQSSWLDPNKVREMTFVGKLKMLVYDDLEPNEKIKIYDKRVEIPRHYDTFAEFQYSYHYGDMHSPYIKQTEPLRVECQHFAECIRSGETPFSDGRNGLEVVQVLEAASASLANGGVRIPLQNPVDTSAMCASVTETEMTGPRRRAGVAEGLLVP